MMHEIFSQTEQEDWTVNTENVLAVLADRLLRYSIQPNETWYRWPDTHLLVKPS